MVLTCIYKNPREGYSFTEDDVYNKFKDNKDFNSAKIKNALRNLQTKQCVTYVIPPFNPSRNAKNIPYYQITQYGEEEVTEYINNNASITEQ